jgi:hypothetical protein
MGWRKDKDATQQGSVLGLGGISPSRDQHDRSHDPEVAGTSGSSAASPDPERAESATGSLHRSKGATGIDMGAGGNGTDIKP